MLCFVPPLFGPPRRDRPEPPPRFRLGIALALVLTLLAMALPWLRPEARRAPAPPVAVQAAPKG